MNATCGISDKRRGWEINVEDEEDWWWWWIEVVFDDFEEDVLLVAVADDETINPALAQSIDKTWSRYKLFWIITNYSF